jgi:hypothetical protein
VIPVYVVVINDEHGTITYVAETEEMALAIICAYAKSKWKKEYGPMPTNEQAVIDQFFEREAFNSDSDITGTELVQDEEDLPSLFSKE